MGGKYGRPEKVEPLTIMSDGLRLSGYFRPADTPGRSRDAVLLCHGYPNKGREAQRSGKSFPQLVDRIGNQLGWPTATINYRGCGASQGNFSMLGWLDDVSAATAHLITLADRIWLVGFGTGGSLCITEAARNPIVAGVAAMSAPADFDDWAGRPRRLVAHSQKVGVISDSNFPRDIEAWEREFRAVRAVDAAEHFGGRPLLLVHGANDDLIPVLDMFAIADAHRGAETRLLAGAGHELRHDPRAVAILIGWLRRTAGQPNDPAPEEE